MPGRACRGRGRSAILWDTDPRLAVPLMAGLREAGFNVGDNEPYDGALKGDTLDEEVTRRGIAGLLVEVRQDLVASDETAGGDRRPHGRCAGAGGGAAGAAPAGLHALAHRHIGISRRNTRATF